MSKAESARRFAGWKVRIEHRFGRCAAEVLRQDGRSACLRSGSYGWYGKGYCYQHHPDSDAWSAEASRMREIALAAVSKAEGRESER